MRRHGLSRCCAVVAVLTLAACGGQALSADGSSSLDLTVRATQVAPSSRAASSTAPPGPSPTPSTTTAPPELLGKVWTVLPIRSHRVALTFDCGGNADGLALVLATLQAKHVARATFFVTGSWARAFPAQAAQLRAAGYVIGNHTEHHLRLTDLTNRQVRREIREGRATVEGATGVDPKPWFRFPFGAYDARVLGVVAAAGWVALGWTVDTLGWQGTGGGGSVTTVVARVLSGLRPGEIVLMHVGSNPDDGSTLDADALATLVDQLRAAGYRFTTPQVML